MIRHISTEDLSAYLDSELGFAEIVPLEAHCASCTECGSRLASLRRVVNGLGNLPRAEPPAALRQQIRRQAQAVPPTPGWQRRLDWLRLLLFPVRPALRTASAFGLAMLAGVFAISHGVADGFLRVSEPPPREDVEAYAGEAPVLLRQTTSEVAGRKFVWTDDGGWVQRGLEWATPETQLDAHSPQGRALLTRYSGLRLLLLEDGSSVILRDNLKTVVEIRNVPTPPRVMSGASQPRPGRRGHVMSA
ncbi:MAG TPA: hypothetical protein VF173_29630 [Thermoanaerobaculia bacterium]|nr:hypothetical protein [Thermoanaerobaculia bacterium]